MEEEDFLPEFLRETGEAGQGLVLGPPQLCLYGTKPDELLGGLAESVNYEMMERATQQQGYYNQEVRGQWNYENVIYHGRYDQRYTDLVHFQTRVGFENVNIPSSADCAEGKERDCGGYQKYPLQPMIVQPQTSDYSGNYGTYGRPCFAEQDIENCDYANQTQNNSSWPYNPESHENPYAYSESYVSALGRDLDLQQEYRANQDGTTSYEALDVETLDWQSGAIDWNLLDIPLDLTMDGQATRHDLRDLSEVSDNQRQCATSFGHLPGANGTSFGHLPVASGTVDDRDPNIETLDWRPGVNDWNSLEMPLDMSMNRQATEKFSRGHSEVLESQTTQCARNLPSPGKEVSLEISSQTKSTGIKEELYPKRRRRRLETSAEEAQKTQPKTKSEQLQEKRESELLASYRPILPRPSTPKGPQRKTTDDCEPAELRKRWRGWKCCSKTFDDFNLYQNHVNSTHGNTDAASPKTRERKKSDTKPIPKKAAPPKTIKSKAIMCPFCSTTHETLGPDIATRPRWNGLDYLLCPLCSRYYKTLRQLKIHFCLHFHVNVNNKPTCRYCSREFEIVLALRTHEAVCMIAHEAKQNRQVEGQEIHSAAEAVASASPAAAAASTAVTRVSKRVSTVPDVVASASPPDASTTTAEAAAVTRVSAAVATVAMPDTAAARISMAASSKLPASTTASAAIAAESNASAAVSAAAAEGASSKATSKSRDERLFYCPDCGKLFTWAGSVRRHQQTSHGYTGPCRRKKC